MSYEARFIRTDYESSQCKTCGLNTLQGLQDTETHEIEPYCSEHLIVHLYFDNRADRERKVEEGAEYGLSSYTK